ALAPVDEITRIARSISARSLAKRLAVPQTGDELQRLSETLNEMIAGLDSTFKRVTQFTADASHELRSGLRSRCCGPLLRLLFKNRDPSRITGKPWNRFRLNWRGPRISSTT